MKNVMVRVYPTVADLQQGCAEQVAQELAPTTNGTVMTVALSGGSTPRRMHELLAGQPHIDWTNVHVFWGDERMVPPDDEASNYRMARESLLSHIDIPESHVHRMPGEHNPQQAAQEYEQTIQKVFGVSPPQMPRFDVILLGMGADGHTASLFPGTEALDERDRYVVANKVPQLDTTRLTLTYPVLNAARCVILLVAGKDKAEAAAQCVGRNDDTPPAGRVRPPDGDLHWLLDSDAAARLSTN